MQMYQLQSHINVNNVSVSGCAVTAAVLTRAALTFNQRIWSLFRGEPTEEDDPLPKRAPLDFPGLKALDDRRANRTTASPDPGKLDINTSKDITAGIRGSPE